MSGLDTYSIEDYTTYGGVQCGTLDISYEVVGQPLHTAPIVVVNHALTGNSDVSSSEKGWWSALIGYGKLIDLDTYTVIAFNIPGNGYDGVLIENYKDFTTKDIAQLFVQSLEGLDIRQAFAVIGGSLGGGIAWEMAVLRPSFFDYLIPVAADWKSTDWVIGFTGVQDNILLNSARPIDDARQMAMFFYRTPSSFGDRFDRTKTADGTLYNVSSWLNHHGKKLEQRFHRSAYLMMNHLLGTIDAAGDRSIEDTLEGIRSKVVQIAVSSDILFTPEECRKTKELLDRTGTYNEYHEIQSNDGHDAFLIEHEQITQFLIPIFSTQHKWNKQFCHTI